MNHDFHSYDQDVAPDLSIVMVCTGNICRSPMAEKILHDALVAAGLDDRVAVSSCGIGSWHIGQPMDRRASAELQKNGYHTEHVAAQVGATHLAADLLLAMDTAHVSELVNRGAPFTNIRLLRSFDPAAPESAIVDDPYYGGVDGFVRTRTEIEAAMPGLMSWIDETLAVRDAE